MAKLTTTPEGEQKPFSTMRGRPDLCSETCKAVYRFGGELYCGYFHEVAYKRCKACIEGEVKEKKV